MTIDSITLTGIIASVFTAVALLPQLFKIIKEKKSEDVSTVMLLVLSIGLALWVTYGLLKNDYIIAGSNGFSLCVNIAIAILTMKYKK